MVEAATASVLRLRGVRHNNLKNFDLDLPLGRLIVITGPSGSGKSSLAFDTLFAEGQRRYIETFSPYARQFFDRMDKPRVDSIEGIPPAIAIEQRNAVRTTRSTVGTMTEICDYLKLLWPHVASLRCRGCGQPVQQDTPQQLWRKLNADPAWRQADLLVTFDLALSERLSLAESLALVAKQGYQRLLVAGSVTRLEDYSSGGADALPRPTGLTVIQDRLRLAENQRARFVEACEQAYHFGKGRLALHHCGGEGTLSRTAGRRASGAPAPAWADLGTVRRFSNRLHCAECDLEYREPSPSLFSFNHPAGACPACKGFGRIIRIDYRRAIPDPGRTLAQGAVKPWQTGMSAECQDDLLKFCRKHRLPIDVPFRDLTSAQQRWVVEGDPDYGKDREHEWPRAWYGVKGYFRWLESKAYKMHVRVLLSRYRSYRPCPDCAGQRLQPEALLYRLPPLTPHEPRGCARESVAESATSRPAALSRAQPRFMVPMRDKPIAIKASHERSSVASGARAELAGQPPPPPGLSLADFYALPIQEALGIIEELGRRSGFHPGDPLGLPLGEVRARLAYLIEVGLGYLTLDRPTRTLSGGETERVNLTTCLGTRLVNTLFVLDEPSVGLHPRDTARLISILERLRDAGNTVVVVEHDAAVIRAADHVVDLGPGHGESGGQIVFQGPGRALLRASTSLTGQYLSGKRRIEPPVRRPVTAPGSRQSAIPAAWLKLAHASRHNLHDVSVELPLNRFVCVTGVSGSGKTTLVKELLLPALLERLQPSGRGAKPSDRRDPEATGDEEADGVQEHGDEASVELSGTEALRRVLLVDQSPLGRTPRSNPAVYSGAFDDIREVFAQSAVARQRGLVASAFSFNSRQGQCERCRGAGYEKIEMQFLSDVFIRCPDCDGRRYRAHILEVRLADSSATSLGALRRPAAPGAAPRGQRESRAHALAGSRKPALPRRAWSIADVLEATVDEAIGFLGRLDNSRAAQRAVAKLNWLQQVGLGYLRLGQPINTLSGGESQRLKLVSYLAASGILTAPPPSPTRGARADVPPAPAAAAPASEPTLFLFDEPTTGLHFDDVRVLLQVFHRLVDAGHSVVVIEHHLDVVRCADWVVDLGPEAGRGGGRIVAAGTAEAVTACAASHTGRALREGL